MAFDIYPPIIDIYPSDQVLFTARATYPPAPWKIDLNNSFGVVQPDSSILPSNPSLNLPIVGRGALRLTEGQGAIEWTLDGNCIPTSTSIFTTNISLRRPPTGGTWRVRVNVTASDIRIDYESGSNVEIIPIPPTVGMKFRLEISLGFRLFIDGVLRHSRTSFSDLVAYPAVYDVVLSNLTVQAATVLTAPPRVPPYRLDGPWRLAPKDSGNTDMLAWAVEHGTLSNGADNLEMRYSGGTVPGTYKLQAQINPGIVTLAEDGAPAGSSVSTTGGSWVWDTSVGQSFSQAAFLKSPLAAGDHSYTFTGATTGLQIATGDVMVCYVKLDPTNPPTEIMLVWTATDGTASEHRAYWGANSIALGTDGTASRRFIGALPATNQWVRLEVPASMVDLENRVVNGMSLRLFNGLCSFDLIGKYPSKMQRAESIIVIPSLKILSDLTQTFQPGQKGRLQTNYDNAQTPNLVTWSVVSGGGSFSGNEYTAPTAPGANVLRASSTGNQAAEVTVNVPEVITPGFKYAAPLEQVDFDTNIPSPTWSSVPSGINGSTGVYTFPNTLGAKVRIQATNGTFTATRDILIAELFPLTDPILPLTWDRNLDALISESEDRTSVITREKSPPYDSYEVRFAARTLAEAASVDAFFDSHGFGKTFILVDSVRGVRKPGRFDSIIHHEGNEECAQDISFRFKEARVD